MYQLFFPLVLLILGVGEKPVTEPIDIHEAIAQNKLKVEAISTGTYNGYSIDLKLISSKLGQQPVKIPAGTHFITKNETEQDIFVVEDQVLALNGKGSQQIKGFCSQATNRSPEKGSGFDITMTKNQELQKLADYINKQKIKSDHQEAVWAVSDRYGVSSIYTDESEAQKLRKFICDLTGQENVWYNTKNNYALSENRTIEITPVEISGMIEFVLEEPATLIYILYRDDEELFKYGGERVFDQKGEYTFNFNLSVKSFRKGDYAFKVIKQGEVVHEQGFVI